MTQTFSTINFRIWFGLALVAAACYCWYVAYTTVGLPVPKHPVQMLPPGRSGIAIPTTYGWFQMMFLNSPLRPIFIQALGFIFAFMSIDVLFRQRKY